MRRKKREQDSFWCDTVVPEANACRMRSVEIAAPPKLVFRRKRTRPASVEELPLRVVTLPARKRESVAN
ncbi:MAG TPA: hypothetical protein VJU01_02875 [Gaiellaceae bacterium]|nr:hypothetical protein [Gaiellaceae bacterium]